MQKLNLKVEKFQKFINFLKRFQGIDNSLLLEIDNGFVKAKSYTPEKSVVKYSAIPLDEVFSEYSDISAPVKVGILNIDKLSSSFKFFGESEFEFILDYENVNGDNTGTGIVLKNSSLAIEFQCASLKLFTYITDDVLNKITDTSSSKVDFLLPKEQQAKISSLFGIDSDHSKITFNKKGDEVLAEGKNFKLQVVDTDVANKPNANLSVFKHHYAFLDREDAIVHIADEKLIFVSNESDTKMIIGEAE
ncbi:MAG: hypothetical protein WC979_01250 [Candidatus Pacearchaeota archaeon]|jgi:hypothetical protein|nr:hypothetical protein [Clostridia bacterium]